MHFLLQIIEILQGTGQGLLVSPDLIHTVNSKCSQR